MVDEDMTITTMTMNVVMVVEEIPKDKVKNEIVQAIGFLHTNIYIYIYIDCKRKLYMAFIQIPK